MQGSSECKLKKYHPLFGELATKISRLRNRLIACGYSTKEITDIIFFQFLHLPQIDWDNLQETTNFYDVKSVLKVDTTSAEIILRLQKIVPNLQTEQACEYLLAVLEINASDFGLNLVESSSDSNDSGSGMNKLIIRRPNRRIKRNKKREEVCETVRKTCEQQKIMRKKVHHDQEFMKRKATEQQVDNFFKTRPVTTLLPFIDYELQKEMKRMPESSDSDHE